MISEVVSEQLKFKLEKYFFTVKPKLRFHMSDKHVVKIVMCPFQAMTKEFTLCQGVTKKEYSLIHILAISPTCGRKELPIHTLYAEFVCP